MYNLLALLAAFVWRHWLRIGIAVVAIVIISRKQINLNVRLGLPAMAQEMVDAGPGVAENGLLGSLNLFGGARAPAAPDPTLLDRLVEVDQRSVDAFVERFAHVAQSEQQKFGIPASIILANGLLQTGAGLGSGTRQLNNWFGLPCTDDWRGASRVVDGACLREYETAWLSFRDHSQYLTTGRFRALRDLPANDGPRWAAGLEELNFNATPGLARQLTQTIDRYHLDRFN